MTFYKTRPHRIWDHHVLRTTRDWVSVEVLTLSSILNVTGLIKFIITCRKDDACYYKTRVSRR